MLEPRVIPDARREPAVALAFLADYVAAQAHGRDQVTISAFELQALAGCLHLVSVEVESLQRGKAVPHG